MPNDNIERFLIGPEEARARMSPVPGPLEDLFFNGTGRTVHKWLHYLPVYDRYLAPYRDRAVMLEIGVAMGGSLDMWRQYFGPSATLFGVDVNPECAHRVEAPNQVRIGSQADPEFLRAVVAEMGAPNIILDDGSHVASHQAISFQALFPLLQDGGIYIIEDLHTAYWPTFEGGLRRPGTGIELVKALVDDQHAWYHDEPEIHASRSDIAAIHFHDSIAVVEKTAHLPPAHAILRR